MLFILIINKKWIDRKHWPFWIAGHFRVFIFYFHASAYDTSLSFTAVTRHSTSGLFGNRYRLFITYIKWSTCWLQRRIVPSIRLRSNSSSSNKPLK